MSEIGKQFVVLFKAGIGSSREITATLIEEGTFYLKFKEGDRIYFLPFWTISILEFPIYTIL